MQQQTRAYAYALAAVLCWSTVASAFKLTLRATGVAELLLLSTVSSSVILVAIAILQRKLGAWRHWPAKEWGHSALLGILNPFLYYLVLFRAYDLLPAQEAQPLNYTWPIVLVLLSSLFLRQRLRGYTLAAMTASLLGVVIISTRGDIAAMRLTDTEGVLLAVGSSLLWASYWILNMRGTADQVLKLAANFLFGSLYVGVFYLLYPGKEAIGLTALLGAVYVGAFEMGLTFVFWLKALTLSTNAARVSSLVYLSPFLSLVVIHLVLGETIHLSTIGGLLLIIGGIAAQRLGETRERNVSVG